MRRLFVHRFLKSTVNRRAPRINYRLDRHPGALDDSLTDLRLPQQRFNQALHPRRGLLYHSQ